LNLDLKIMKKPTVPHQLSSRLDDLRSDLKVRQYKDSKILPVFEKAPAIPRSKALEKVERNYVKEKRFNLPIPYNPRLPDYGTIIKQHWSQMLKKYPDLKKALTAPPRICYKMLKNLRDILVRAKLSSLS